LDLDILIYNIVFGERISFISMNFHVSFFADILACKADPYEVISDSDLSNSASWSKML